MRLPALGVHRRLATLVIGLVLAGTASCTSARPATPRAIDPVGRFDYTSTANGQPINGSITIERRESAYMVVMTTGGMTRDILFQDARLEGDRLTATTQTPAGAPVALHVRFDGNAITGDWTLGPQTGTLRGTRSAAAR